MVLKSMKIGLLLAVSGLACTASADEALRKDIAADYDKNLSALFTHFHQNPELSFKETKTAERLAKEIEALGYDVTTGVGRTGVVAVLKNKNQFIKL